MPKGALRYVSGFPCVTVRASFRKKLTVFLELRGGVSSTALATTLKPHARWAQLQNFVDTWWTVPVFILSKLRLLRFGSRGSGCRILRHGAVLPIFAAWCAANTRGNPVSIDTRPTARCFRTRQWIMPSDRHRERSTRVGLLPSYGTRSKPGWRSRPRASYPRFFMPSEPYLQDIEPFRRASHHGHVALIVHGFRPV